MYVVYAYNNSIIQQVTNSISNKFNNSTSNNSRNIIIIIGQHNNIITILCRYHRYHYDDTMIKTNFLHIIL